MRAVLCRARWIPAGRCCHRGDAIYMITVSRVQDGEVILGALCVFIDMTLFESTARRMRAYAELTAQQDAILNALSEGLWICDGQGQRAAHQPGLGAAQRHPAPSRWWAATCRSWWTRASSTAPPRWRCWPARPRCPSLQAQQGRKLALTGIPVFDEARRTDPGGGDRAGRHRDRGPAPGAGGAGGHEGPHPRPHAGDAVGGGGVPADHRPQPVHAEGAAARLQGGRGGLHRAAPGRVRGGQGAVRGPHLQVLRAGRASPW